MILRGYLEPTHSKIGFTPNTHSHRVLGVNVKAIFKMITCKDVFRGCVVSACLALQ